MTLIPPRPQLAAPEPRDRRRRTLTCLACLGVVCALTGPGRAWAQDGDAPPTGGDSAASARAAIKAERARLQAEKAELEQLKIDLKAAEAALQKKIDALKAARAAQDKVKADIQKLRDAVLDEKMQRLVALCEKMQPAAAAAYLSKMKEPTASQILQGMKLRQASKVMAKLSPSKAAALSRRYLKDDSPLSKRPGGGPRRR